MMSKDFANSCIRDGGGFGSIIGRNSFQRKKPDALRLLDTSMKVYGGKE
jgi:class I fructose-bisphosphate aldolase